MKQYYVLLTLKIICGDYEFYSIAPHQVSEGQLEELEKDEEEESEEGEETDWSIDVWAESYAASFYAGRMYENDGWYNFDAGSVAVCVNELRKLNKREYNLLTKYLR